MSAATPLLPSKKRACGRTVRTHADDKSRWKPGVDGLCSVARVWMRGRRGVGEKNTGAVPWRNPSTVMISSRPDMAGPSALRRIAPAKTASPYNWRQVGVSLECPAEEGPGRQKIIGRRLVLKPSCSWNGCVLIWPRSVYALYIPDSRPDSPGVQTDIAAPPRDPNSARARRKEATDHFLLYGQDRQPPA